MSITTKNRLFIAEYMRDLNATQAAIRAGYSQKTAYSIGQELLNKPEIKAEIDAQIGQKIMSSDEILQRLSDIARGDMSDLMALSKSGFTFELLQEDESGNRSPNPKTKLIKRIKQKVTTYLAKSESQEDREIVETDLELLDQQAALNTLAKYRGLLVERTEITGKDGGAIPIEMFERAVSKVYGESG